MTAALPRLLAALVAAAALAAALAPASSAAPPAAGFYALELDGLSCGFFAGAAIDEGRVVLGRGSGSPALIEWAVGQRRADPEVVVYGASGTPLARYRLHNARIVKWELAELDASKNEISIETLEIAAAEVRRA
jgi:hypothetical protein